MAMTVSEAKDELFKELAEGKHLRCPVCEQSCKRYKRKITSAMAVALIHIYRYYRKHAPDDWLHVEEYLKGIQGLPASIRGDFPKLRYWSLIEACEGERPDGSKRVGYYRITKYGNAFVEGIISVQKHAYIYNNKLLMFSPDKTTIQEALGEKFDYTELMKQ